MTGLSNRGQVRFAATARMVLPPTTEALFSQLGLGLKLVETAETEQLAPQLVCARVALSANRLAGFLSLSMPRKTVIALTPGVCSTPEDWVAELCDQVAGRFSNRLGRRGVALKVQPPVLARATPSVFVPSDHRWLFRAGEHTALLELDVVVESDFQFTTPVAGAALSEGAVVLFGNE